MVRKRVICWILLLVVEAVARAESVDLLAHIHAEAIGGRARLARIEALQARGRVIAAGETMEFELVAQRPNRVRITMNAGGRVLVQGFDGAASPWRWAPNARARAMPMNAKDGREFAVDAEFDDPLASPVDRGYRLDFAGELEWHGRRAFRVLVTRPDTAPSFLVLDSDTYFIVARITSQPLASGHEQVVETRFDDFRPVSGVILPHRIDTHLNGQLTRQTLLTSVRAIPAPPVGTFTMPDGSGGASDAGAAAQR